MSSGIVFARAFKNFLLSNSFKYPSSRIIAAAQCPKRLYGVNQPIEGEGKERDPKDRSVKISVETSIRYLKSQAYQATYGDEPVWIPYRRNFKGQYTPRLTRPTCIKNDRIITGNPCPICRDEYLVLHEANVDLLKQFISPHTGQILTCSKTHICQQQFDHLMISILKAREQGLLTFDVPFRHYDYSDYNPHLKQKHNEQQ